MSRDNIIKQTSKMLSILIPIHNFNISPLINNLERQIQKLDYKIEIIVFDDHSTKNVEENKKVAQKFNLKYKYLERNLGRSRIINLLAEHASFDYLLILDCDVFPKSNLFLSNYLTKVNNKTEVIYGGRKHEYKKENTHKLRWKYGYYKEDKTANQRKKNPYLSTLTNNLLIKRSLFESIRFKESITKYGHEDTLFAYELKKKKARIKHIDNPVIHKDIDDDSVFIEKTEMALQNLKIIFDSKLIPAEEIQILRVYEKMKSLKLEGLFTRIFMYFENHIRNRLTSDRNSVTLFNIYKLGYFCKINRK